MSEYAVGPKTGLLNIVRVVWGCIAGVLGFSLLVSPLQSDPSVDINWSRPYIGILLAMGLVMWRSWYRYRALRYLHILAAATTGGVLAVLLNVVFPESDLVAPGHTLGYSLAMGVFCGIGVMLILHGFRMVTFRRRHDEGTEENTD